MEPNPYWEGRKGLLYYQVVRILAEDIGKDAESIIDVGSAGCPYLDWFPQATHRTSLDLTRPYEAPGVQSFKGDFLTWTADRQYDVVTCLQVLEHVPDARAFAQKLLATGKTVIVSVPYKWRKGHTESHVHDPVDKAKLRAWFGRRPSFQYVVTEVSTRTRRIVHVYDASPIPWASLSQRAIFITRDYRALRRKIMDRLLRGARTRWAGVRKALGLAPPAAAGKRRG